MRFMQIESVLQTKNRSEPAKNRAALMYCLPPPKGYIHVENHEKVCIKSDGIADF